MTPWGALIDLGKSIFEGISESKRQKRELKAAKHERRIEVVRQGRVNEATWNEKHIEKGAWRANYMTIVLSLPLIGVFVPFLVPYVEAGFTALDATPEWYRAAVAVMISAAFGYQKFSDWQMRKAYGMPDLEEKV